MLSSLFKVSNIEKKYNYLNKQMSKMDEEKNEY